MIRHPLEQQGGAIFDEISDSWEVWPFIKKYDNPQNPEENSFLLDAVIAYCKVPVPKSTSCSVVYYTGVRYPPFQETTLQIYNPRRSTTRSYRPQKLPKQPCSRC